MNFLSESVKQGKGVVSAQKVGCDDLQISDLGAPGENWSLVYNRELSNMAAHLKKLINLYISESFYNFELI